MSVHTRETAFKQSLLLVNDPMVPRGIERLSLYGEWLVLNFCHATDVRLEWCAVTGVRLAWVLVESSV